MKKRLLTGLAAAALLVTVQFVPATPLFGQHLRYRTTTKMNLESLGFIGKFLNSEMKEEVSIHGNLKRIDRKDNSTITNLDTEEIITLNHKKKEYSVITFDDLTAMMESVVTSGTFDMDQMDDADDAGSDAEFSIEFDLSVEETGKTRKLEGHQCEQKVLIMKMLIEPEDEAAADSLPSTALYAITDLWIADEVPELALNEEFNRKMAEILRQDFSQSNMSGIVNVLMKSDPRVGAAMDKAKEGMEDLEGTTLLSTMYLVTVPPDMDLDLALVLGEKKKKKKGFGIGGFLKQAAKAQGVDVGDDAPPEAPEQATLFSTESKTGKINNKSRKPEYYQTPSNYKLVEFEMPSMLPADGS